MNRSFSSLVQVILCAAACCYRLPLSGAVSEVKAPSAQLRQAFSGCRVGVADSQGLRGPTESARGLFEHLGDGPPTIRCTVYGKARYTSPPHPTPIFEGGIALERRIPAQKNKYETTRWRETFVCQTNAVIFEDYYSFDTAPFEAALNKIATEFYGAEAVAKARAFSQEDIRRSIKKFQAAFVQRNADEFATLRSYQTNVTTLDQFRSAGWSPQDFVRGDLAIIESQQPSDLSLANTWTVGACPGGVPLADGNVRESALVWQRFDAKGRSFKIEFLGTPLLKVCRLEFHGELLSRIDWCISQSELAALAKYKEPPAPLPITKALPRPKPDGQWENSLGMKFVPVPGAKVLFSVWETRVRDYAYYAAANRGVDTNWWDWDDLPVVNVNWNDAHAFCKWLTSKERGEGSLGEDQKYRLPTDEEWSWAIGIGDREGSGTPKAKNSKLAGVYPWGTQWPPKQPVGNFADQSARQISKGWSVIKGYTDGYMSTSPVGQFVSNNGLFDLSGNVWEWCEDKYDGTAGGPVLRGGSWKDGSPEMLLSSARISFTPDRRDAECGFRCVLVAADQAR